MKQLLYSLLAATSVAFVPTVLAADTHGHGHSHAAKMKAPNGGRIVHSVEPHFELFVTAERKLQVTFLDEHGKAIAPAARTVTATGGSRAKPTKFKFTMSGDTLLSDKPLPEGKVIPVIMRIKMTADSKTVTERLSLNLADCPTCKYKEYACTCAH